MKSKAHHVSLVCSFCGKSQREVRKLIAGPTVFICDECIKLCRDTISQHTGDPTDSQTVRSLAETAQKLAGDLRLPPSFPRWILDHAISLAKELERLAEPKKGKPVTPKRHSATLCCSFCGKSQDEVSTLIAGPSVYVCDECVSLGEEIISEKDDDSPRQFAQTARSLAVELRNFPTIPRTAIDRASLLAQELERLVISEDRG